VANIAAQPAKLWKKRLISIADVGMPDAKVELTKNGKGTGRRRTLSAMLYIGA
jgi:hypothetical protein